MTRTKFAATTALVGLSALAASLAYASSDARSAEDLQSFLTANPEVAAVVADVEAETGGIITEAEFDDDSQGGGIVEFEIEMADGSEQEVLYVLADGTMTVELDDDDGDDDLDGDDDNEGDDDK